jgi:hypothetical protein
MSWNIKAHLPEGQPGEAHVFPTDEEILHNLEGTFCFCSPRIEETREGNIIVVHASTDGREFRE